MMKTKAEKVNEGDSKEKKILGTKTLKKDKSKSKKLKHSQNVPMNNADESKVVKRKEKMSEASSEVPKKKPKAKQNVTDQSNGLPSNNTSPSGKKANNIKKKKKKTFNKEAIEKMKARQQAKKEKLMKHNSPAVPEKPDVKRRRPKLPVRLENVELKFSEDDESMAQFEGMWVPREETGRLQSAREELEKRGLPADRVDRRMKLLVRKEHRKLKLSMIAAQTKTERAARERRQFLEAQQTPRARRKVPGKTCGLTLQEGERLARFDGFWVSAEAVPRLEALRQQLAASGKPESETIRLLRKARRAEERKVKACGRLLCTRCGGRGHLLSDCTAQAVEPAAGTACFRCGEAGHRLSDCPKKGQISGLPFATCFLCKQQGHMSRECPQADSEAAAPKSGKAGQKTVGKKGGGQSWRGLTHDDNETAAPEPAGKKMPAKLVAKPLTKPAEQKPRVHIRFD